MDSHKSERAEIAAKVANYQMSPKKLVDTISQDEIKRWSELLREKLLDTTVGFPKEYLQLLIKEIVLTGKEVRVSGDPRALGGDTVWQRKQKIRQPQKQLSDAMVFGAPGEIRTPDTQVRSLVLYPAELRAQ